MSVLFGGSLHLLSCWPPDCGPLVALPQSRSRSAYNQSKAARFLSVRFYFSFSHLEFRFERGTGRDRSVLLRPSVPLAWSTRVLVQTVFPRELVGDFSESLPNGQTLRDLGLPRSSSQRRSEHP